MPLKQTAFFRRRPKTRWLWLALILLATGGCAFFLLGRLNRYLEIQNRLTLLDSIKRAAVNCYAIEGAYPQELSYLEEHYGVVVNHDKFLVEYDVFASNLLPQIDVIPRGQWTLEGGAYVDR